jgi:hypothetical protein
VAVIDYDLNSDFGLLGSASSSADSIVIVSEAIFQTEVLNSNLLALILYAAKQTMLSATRIKTPTVMMVDIGVGIDPSAEQPLICQRYTLRIFDAFRSCVMQVTDVPVVSSPSAGSAQKESKWGATFVQVMHGN